MISRAPYRALHASFDPLPAFDVVKVGVATGAPELAPVVKAAYPVVILCSNRHIWTPPQGQETD